MTQPTWSIHYGRIIRMEDKNIESNSLNHREILITTDNPDVKFTHSMIGKEKCPFQIGDKIAAYIDFEEKVDKLIYK